MSLYLIQNQASAYLDKQLNWSLIPDPNQLFRTPHKDVALNQLVELNARDISMRAVVVSCEVNEKGLPIIEAQRAEPMASAG